MCQATTGGKQGWAPPVGLYSPASPAASPCVGCPYNIWPPASNGRGFTEWKYPAIKAGCYGLQYNERRFPPFDKLDMKLPLAVCSAGVVHTVTIDKKP